MSRPQRAAQARIVEAQRSLRGLADPRQADDEQIVVSEDEMLRPTIAARIEQPIGAAACSMGHLPCFGNVAEGAAPGEVVQVLGTTPLSNWAHRGELVGYVVVPESRGNYMVDVELADSGPQAVFARVTSPQAYS